MVGKRRSRSSPNTRGLYALPSSHSRTSARSQTGSGSVGKARRRWALGQVRIRVVVMQN